MEFSYNGSSSAFKLVSIQNEIDLEASCFRCTRFSALSWTQLQASIFWGSASASIFYLPVVSTK